MQSYWRDITPAIAAELLKSDVPKRSLSPGHERALARDMSALRWKPSPQGIVLDHDGRLMDGWHRMSAVVRAGVTVCMYVTVTENETETKEIERILDLGRPRSFSDRLTFEGRVNTKLLAAITRRAFHWKAGDPWAHRVNPTSEELDLTVQQEPDLEVAAGYGKTWDAHGLLSGTAAGFCWWVLHQVDAEEADMFMYALKTGIGLEAGNVVLALRERLREDAVQIGRRKLSVDWRIWLVFHAWGLYRARKFVKQIKMPTNPVTNENFPRPE
jgi:hypothetical protein